jgi:hypothetical protein
MQKLLLAFGLTFFMFGTACAQNLHFFGMLPAWNQTGKIGPQLNYNLFLSNTLDLIPERVNGVYYPATDLQLYVQPSLVYVHSPALNFGGSYTYQRSNPFNSRFINEHRLWQQAIYSFPFMNGRCTQRLRLEERFIQNRTTGLYPLATRLRYQLGLNLPLQGKQLEPGEYYLNAYNEAYFSLSGIKNATYSEDWAYTGIGYHTGPWGKVELGCLLQTAVRNPQHDLRFLYLTQLSWITSFEPHHHKA